jgi:hypothetical protein
MKDVFSYQLWRVQLRKETFHAIEKLKMVEGLADSFIILLPSNLVES